MKTNLESRSGTGDSGRTIGVADRPRRRRRGLALLMVVVVLAIVAVLGFAMLSSSSIRAAASANMLRAASAESLAESGVELASLYLLYPQKCPTPIATGTFWSGGSDISLGADVPGTIDVVVSKLGAYEYKIVSTGKTGNSVKRTVTAEVRVDPGFRVRHGAAFSGNATTTLKTKIYGDVQVKGLLTNLGLIEGLVHSLLEPVGALLGWEVLDDGNMTDVPSPTAVRDYSTYTYNGVVYSAKEITTIPSGTVLGPTADNPAGIYIARAGLTMYSNTRINGTLVMGEGATLNVSGGANEINPAPGFPAAVLKGDIYLRGLGSSRNLKINGLTWVGGSVKSGGLLLADCYLNVNGAMLFGGGGSVDTLFLGALNVTFDPTKLSGIDLDSTVAPPGVKVTSFK